jgi:hypothetical protein
MNLYNILMSDYIEKENKKKEELEKIKKQREYKLKSEIVSNNDWEYNKFYKDFRKDVILSYSIDKEYIDNFLTELGKELVDTIIICRYLYIDPQTNIITISLKLCSRDSSKS